MGLNWPYAGVDTSWPQENYKPGSESFVIVGAASDDGGEFVQKTYHEQVDSARAAKKEVGHYFFNGALDAATFAAYCVANLYSFGANDTAWLDVESPNAYSPAKALAFGNEFKALTGVMPGVYINVSEKNQGRLTKSQRLSGKARRKAVLDQMASGAWNANIAAGQMLWLAYPGAWPGGSPWPDAQIAMWQYTISGGVDRDYAQYTQAAIRQMQEGDDMSAADVAAINANTNAQIATVLAGVRREARARWYTNQTTGAHMLAHQTDGFLLDPPGATPAAQLAWIQAQVTAANLLVTADEKAQPISQATWDEVRAEVANQRASFGTVALTDAQVQALATQLAAVLPTGITQAELAEFFATLKVQIPETTTAAAQASITVPPATK